MSGPVVYIRSERAANGPGGLHWPHDGAIVAVRDVALAHQILAIEGFREAVPPPDHPVREPAPEPTAARALPDGDGGSGETSQAAAGPGKGGRPRGTRVTE